MSAGQDDGQAATHAIAAGEWLRGLVFWYRWKSRAWETQSLVEPREAPAAVALGG